ncbi:MAG TPA: 30S ribosomal protein S17 [Patescibacteria group bacterium]|nr:30S ribosomal protein S17 [Patescibacteria group bacterium]
MDKKVPTSQRTFTGKVVSTAMHKTITVQVDTMKLNEKYHKKYRVSKKFHVHNEASAVAVGDVVNFVECRPMSKTKRWRLVTTTEQQNNKTKKQ